MFSKAPICQVSRAHRLWYKNRAHKERYVDGVLRTSYTKTILNNTYYISKNTKCNMLRQPNVNFNELQEDV